MPVQSGRAVEREATQDWIPEHHPDVSTRKPAEIFCPGFLYGDWIVSIGESDIKKPFVENEAEEVFDVGDNFPLTFCPGSQFPLTAPPVEHDVLPAYEAKCPTDPSQPDSEDTETETEGEESSSQSSPCTPRNGVEVLIPTQKEDSLRGTWYILSTLGEGAYGEVRSACHCMIEDCQSNFFAVLMAQQDFHMEFRLDIHKKCLLAMKVIHLPPQRETEQRLSLMKLLKRETLIHKNLQHDNIVRFVATRERLNCTYIFLEYACGGELYDRITPDFGVPRRKCHKWFVELVCAMEYLHRRGVVHRDIKPENLLLNEKDVIKLSDFGLATLFKDQGRLRKINSRRGTPSYVAPEVYSQDQFHAQPLDIWSAGVVLVAMVSGELPWEQATLDHEAYCFWKMSSLTLSPWTKVPTECLALLRKMLDPNPDTRATITQIQADHWFKRGFTDKAIGAPAPKRMRLESVLHTCSLPQNLIGVRQGSFPDESSIHLLSQPVRLEDLLLTQTQGVQSLEEQSPLARLVKRMTRFFLTRGVKEVVDSLKEILEQMHMSIARTSPGSYSVSGQDRLKGPLVMKISFVQIHSKLLMDFRLSKGDGLEFKRVFAILREKLNHFIDEDEVEWNSESNGEYEHVERTLSEGFD